jgi:hypothetical protein
MKSTLSLLSYLEVAYLFILPFMGYIATGILNEKYVMMPFLGIGLLFIFQTIALGLWDYQKKSKNSATHFYILISIALTVFNFINTEESFWLFWAEKALFELGAFSVAMAFSSFFGKNSGLGLGAMLAGILLPGLWETATAWYNNNPYFSNGNQIYLIGIGLSTVLDALWTYQILNKLLKKEIIIKDMFDNRYGMTVIVIELILWIVGVPLTLFLMGFLGNS